MTTASGAYAFQLPRRSVLLGGPYLEPEALRLLDAAVSPDPEKTPGVVGPARWANAAANRLTGPIDRMDQVLYELRGPTAPSIASPSGPPEGRLVVRSLVQWTDAETQLLTSLVRAFALETFLHGCRT